MDETLNEIQSKNCPCDSHFSSKKGKAQSVSLNKPILVKSLINRKQSLWLGTKRFFNSH